MNGANLFISPVEFFRGKVNEASDSLRVCLGDDLEFYVVNLLCDFIDLTKVDDELFANGESILDKPLALVLQEAQETDYPERRLSLFRRLGDTSLYVSGYFQEYFNRKTFDISYYIEMGALAYNKAAELRRQNENGENIFDELSNHFPQLVDVVAEVSDRPGEKSNQNILAVYDRWNRSNSRRLLKILQDLGIDPISTVKTAQ